MFGGILAAFNASPDMLTGQQSVTDPRQLVLTRLEKAAKRHSDAVEAALAAEPDSEGGTPQHLVEAILKAGQELDVSIQHCLRQGLKPAELLKVEGLHPRYLAELQQAADELPA